MSELDHQPLSAYLQAVRRRKPYMETMSGNKVNVAILMELQSRDVPRLLQIIEVYTRALAVVMTLDQDFGAKMRKHAEEAIGSVNELAKAGNKARWGEYLDLDPAVAPTKFRSKPVEKEAFQWFGLKNAMPGWMAGKGWAISEDHLKLIIPTMEGTMEASYGDWIIQGLKGEIYPCKPDIFANSYEPA